MNGLDEFLQTVILDFSAWEAIAVFFGLIYLILASRENILCWYAALISTGVSIYVFWDVNLFMESSLQVYYLFMAVYGWSQWRRGDGAADQLPISTWTLNVHACVIGGTLLISLISGYLLTHNTSAAWPYLDSLTTWAGVLTTYMVAKKILENWLYWIVIDAISIFLYLQKDLYLYSGLFLIYIFIAVFGYLQWQKNLAQSREISRSGTPAV